LLSVRPLKTFTLFEAAKTTTAAAARVTLIAHAGAFQTRATTVALLAIITDRAYHYIACSPRPLCTIASSAIADTASFEFRVTYPMPIAYAQACARTYDFLAGRACKTIITFASECVIHIADALIAAPLIVTTQRD